MNIIYIYIYIINILQIADLFNKNVIEETLCVLQNIIANVNELYVNIDLRGQSCCTSVRVRYELMD